MATKLLNLDIDEGIRIESSGQGKKIFINKNASGIFVVQLVTGDKDSSDDNNIRYFDFANEVIGFVKSVIKKHFSVWEY